MASKINVDKIARGSGTPEFTIPTADGTSGQFLKTDGSGVLSFGAVTTTALTGSTNTWIPTITGANALTGTANFTYDGNVLDIKNGGTASSINLYCETGNAHYIKLKSGPHSGATSYTLTLPNAPPSVSGQSLTATTAGVASWTSTTIVVVHMSSSQGFAKDVWEKIDFDTEVFDTNGEYDTTNKRFTPTTPGYYLFSMSLVKDDQESQVNNIYTGVYKNGSLYKSQKILGNYPYYQIEHFIPIFQTIVHCNGSSDYLEPWFSWGANGTLELDVYPDSLTTGKTELTIAKVD